MREESFPGDSYLFKEAPAGNVLLKGIHRHSCNTAGAEMSIPISHLEIDTMKAFLSLFCTQGLVS